MRCITLAVAALSLSGCGKALVQDLGAAGSAPGMIYCAGHASISGVGQVGMVGGANFNITSDCGNGAYIGSAYPTGPLPTMPTTTTPQITGFPPIGRPPTTTP